jgi:hypothetical protein
MWFDDLKFRWNCMARQARLRYLRSEIDDTQERCAQLGAYVGELIAEKSRLEIEAHREDQVLSK